MECARSVNVESEWWTVRASLRTQQGNFIRGAWAHPRSFSSRRRLGSALRGNALIFATLSGMDGVYAGLIAWQDARIGKPCPVGDFPEAMFSRREITNSQVDG